MATVHLWGTCWRVLSAVLHVEYCSDSLWSRELYINQQNKKIISTMTQQFFIQNRTVRYMSSVVIFTYVTSRMRSFSRVTSAWVYMTTRRPLRPSHDGYPTALYSRLTVPHVRSPLFVFSEGQPIFPGPLFSSDRTQCMLALWGVEEQLHDPRELQSG